MIRKILKVLMWLVLAFLAFVAFSAWRNWDTIQRVFLGGLKVYETTPPPLPADIKRPAILVFSKTNAFRHEEAIPAANAMFDALGKERGWTVFKTENGAAFSPAILAKFDAVIFNNASGDVFTPDQEAAFKAYLEDGGGYVGIHAAGDNSHKEWGWYMDQVIGATFTQHTMNPQFQKAVVRAENASHPAMQGLPASWQRIEEWYSFDKSPRTKGFTILATVDEQSYNPEGMFGANLRMGDDHPAVWARCIGKGRVFYTSFGHKAEAFSEAETKMMLANATAWAITGGDTGCSPAPAQAKE
jgi:uncharacterized protein